MGDQVGFRVVWYFIVAMTLYNALKYPIVVASNPQTNPYRISSIVGGTVKAATPYGRHCHRLRVCCTILVLTDGLVPRPLSPLFASIQEIVSADSHPSDGCE
jgi:hypothetical protein